MEFKISVVGEGGVGKSAVNHKIKQITIQFTQKIFAEGFLKSINQSMIL